ncbi:hypothetical protein J6590_060884 [Homalodisca vitripennis]|nr:hypothetical protein J6590_060884 [Homalodisca vitripennis]
MTGRSYLFLLAVLVAVMFSMAVADKVPSCADIKCGPGRECYLQQVQCVRAPCYPIPSCRPDRCDLILCASPKICRNGTCVNP